MSKAKRPPRGRAARRLELRRLEKLAEDREKLFRLEPGGSRDRPIEVASVAVIEPRALSRECPRCGGGLRVEEHAAHRFDATRLREVVVRCAECARKRSLWFRLIAAEPN